MPDGFNNILNILNNPNQYQWDKLNKYTPNPQVPLIPLQKEMGKTIDGKNNYFINDNLKNPKLSTELIGAKYYKDKPIIDENGSTVYAEEIIIIEGGELEGAIIHTERIYKNKYAKSFDNFELVVFIHTDGALILQQNDEVEAKSNQLVLFLEANNKSNYFGSVLRAKVGSDVKMDDLPYADIFRFIEEGHPVNISNKEIKELITKSNLKNKGRFLIKVFNTILKPGSKLADFIFSRLANFAKDTIPDFFEKNLKIQENRWNPNAKDYSPLFMNRGLELIIQQQKRIKTKPVQYLKNVIKPIDEILDALDERINNCNDYIIKHLHRSIALRLVKAIRHVKKQLKDVKDFFSKSVDWLVEIIETGFETANAFICGIINSIIDAVSGLFQLVGWVCYAVAIYNKIKSDLVYSFSLLIEFVENILEAIFEFNLIGFVKDIILLPVRLTKGIIKLLKQLPEIDLGKLLEKIGSSLSNIAYVCGYIVGFIIQLVLEAFFTGGVKAAETMIAKIMAFLKNPIAGVGAGLRAVKEVGEDIFKAAFRKLSKFFEDLKTGKAKATLKQWIEDVLAEIKKMLGISDEVIESVLLAYNRKYQSKKLQPLVDVNKAHKLYGTLGKKLVQSVDSYVFLVSKNFSKKISNSFVMVSGMAYKNRKGVEIFTNRNFIKEEIGIFVKQKGKYIDVFGNDSVFQKFIDNMHPTLKKRYEEHLKQISKGLKASSDDIERAAIPATHGEIRALDDLLKKIDSNSELGDTVFKDIVGYNRILRGGSIKIQPTCAHCFYLTSEIKFIGF